MNNDSNYIITTAKNVVKKVRQTIFCADFESMIIGGFTIDLAEKYICVGNFDLLLYDTKIRKIG
jgi:hypothetical protein